MQDINVCVKHWQEAFLVSNIPTVVFGGIWLHYKGRRDTQDDLKRMRVEDLG